MINSDPAGGFWLNSIECCVEIRANTCIVAYKSEPEWRTYKISEKGEKLLSTESIVIGRNAIKKTTTQVFPEEFEAELFKTQIRPNHGNTGYTAQGTR